MDGKERLPCQLTRVLNAFLLVTLVSLMIGATSIPKSAGDDEISVVTRIEKGTDWILGKAVEYRYGGYAFSRGTGGSDERVYCEDNARVAWTLANYHKDFSTDRHDRWLRASVEFVLEAQTNGQDFCRYYDMKQKQWLVSGSFYYWNSHVIALLAQTAFTMRKLPERSIEHGFWDNVVQRIESCVDSWIENSMKEDGGWIFSYLDSRSIRTEDVGMMLNALACISGYEKVWGDANRAERFSRAAKKTCTWILEQQEMNQDSWGYGGYYDDHSRATQTTVSNGRTMFGLLSFWSFAGLTIQQPDYNLLRRRMIAWTDGFVLKMTDSHGGPAENRTKEVISFYPKRTLAAAELIRDLMLIWVNLGGSYYWNLTQLTYYWLVGKNEMSLDMQQIDNATPTTGSFYTGVENATYVNRDSSTDTTAQCVEAMLHAMSVDIPEFPHHDFTILTAILATVSLLVQRRQRRLLLGSPCSSAGS